MYEELFGKLYGQNQMYVAPVMKANKIAVDNFEKLVAMQMANMEYFVNLGMAQIKSAVEVDSPKAMQDYFGKQMETAEAVREKLLDNTQKLVEIGTDMKDEFTKLAQESGQEFGKTTARGTAKKAA